MTNNKRTVLVVGGGFSGLLVARDLASKFNVVVVDAKSYFEYTPGVLRAFVKPQHLNALTFELAPVIERKLGAKFIWGEVVSIDGKSQTAQIKTIYSAAQDTVHYDFCVLASGCNFNFLAKFGESLWFPTIHECGREVSAWKHIDERYLEGRRRHVLEEHDKLKKLNKQGATVLVSGAGFIGVEWATELQHYFPKLKISIIDFLPKCLGPLPDAAARYCDRYMEKVGISRFYGLKYEPDSQSFWDSIGLPMKADITYLCMGVKASSYYMPADTLSERGPGGGGWILMNRHLQVTTREGDVWGNGNVFAVGDCNYGCIETKGKPPGEWEMPPVPKISYPGEEQATHAVHSIRALDKREHGGGGGCCAPSSLRVTWWPWGAGMFATSLGPHDANFVAGANFNKGSGLMCNWSRPGAIQKEFIETSKVDECKGGLIGTLIWHFVHHTPMHLWGKGPLMG